MNRDFKKMIRWPFGCLIFFLFSCRQPEVYKDISYTKEDSIAEINRTSNAYDAILLAGNTINSGDLITRTGNDFTSRSLRLLNRRNRTYSHCGIASIEHDSVFVYHALGGEWNPDQKIRRDLLKDFADPAANLGMGIFSYRIPDSMHKNLVSIVREYYQSGLMFDMDFDLKTDDRMYCAEFVYKSLVKTGTDPSSFNRSQIDSFEFIGVDDLFLHPRSVMKKEIIYK